MNESLKNAIDHLLEIRARRSELEDELKTVKNEEKLASDSVTLAIADLADMAGVPVEEFKVNMSGYNWKVKTATFFNIPGEARDDVYDKLNELGYGDIVTRTVNRNNLANAMKDINSGAEGVPDTFAALGVTDYTETTISAVKAR